VNEAEFDRALGIIRTKGKFHLVSLVRLFVSHGFSRSDIAAVFAYLGQGLSEDVTGAQLDWMTACSQGALERRRGAFEEFYDLPRNERVTAK
jgi:hypothetical protein